MSCKNAMQDGRAFTDYTSSCSANDYVQKLYRIPTSTSYRMFLQHNAEQLMKHNRALSERNNLTGCKCNYNHPPHNWGQEPYFPIDPNNTQYLLNEHKMQTAVPSIVQSPW